MEVTIGIGHPYKVRLPVHEVVDEALTLFGGGIAGCNIFYERFHQGQTISMVTLSLECHEGRDPPTGSEISQSIRELCGWRFMAYEAWLHTVEEGTT